MTYISQWREKKKCNAHSAVTRELLHVTPSQGAPQGSFDFSQLGGVFCQISFKDWSAAAAPINIRIK